MSEDRSPYLTIRAARASDADVIADFNRRLASESEGRDLDPETLSRGVAALLSDPNRGQYWVAELPGPGRTDENGGVGKLAGQCLVTTEWSDWMNGRYWWFQSVYVAPEWRRQGVLRALWDHVETAARKACDVASLRLYVETDNVSARTVYEKLGMEESGYLVYERWLKPR